MITIYFRSLLIGISLPLSAILIMGSGILERFDTIKAKEYQVVNEHGVVVESLFDSIKMLTTVNKMQNLKINELEDKIGSTDDISATIDIYKRLEKKWIGSSQHIQALQEALADQARKQNLENKEIEAIINDKVDDLNTKVRVVKKDLKQMQRREIGPLKTDIKLVKVNGEKLKQILELDIIQKAIEKSKK